MHPAVTALVALLVGWTLGLLLSGHRRPAERERLLREAERLETDKALARSRREMQDLVDRGNEQALVFQLLPDLVRQIFTASGQRTIGPLALHLVEQLFHPEQAAILVARASRKRLVLVGGLGLPGPLKAGAEVEYGRGRIGYAADHRVTLDDSDFRMAPGEKVIRAFDARKHLEGSGLQGLEADVVAPIVDGRDLLGVLSMAGARTRQGQEKKLMTMVADLASVAIVHATRLRATEESGRLDGLTGVHNRTVLFERLAEELRRAEKDGTPVSVLVLDLDHFQHYNRTNGSVQGDEVLKGLALVLKRLVRENDIVARFGGEEFVVVFVGAGKELAMRLGEKLRHAVEEQPFPHRGQQPLGAITVSGGVATYPEDSRRAEHLIRCADQALYEAKAAGRNRIFPGEPHFLA
ncbi:MAG: sensor domain-containing diguanylate cyclase [Acidobacteria bacterium]|nr:sensor domain-containing diguanylate cyclase [Acidobacteriota bacterium]